jgi:dTDP-4-dehydrorhamnose reductase
MKVIITGGTGFLGNELYLYLSRYFTCYKFGYRNVNKTTDYKVDLTNKEDVFSALNKIHPDVIIHAAALTNVDYCQHHPVDAYLLNAQSTRNLVDWVKSCNKKTRFIYISTDQVYSGESPDNYENSASPINIYGITKLHGEDLALSLENSIALRTNFVSIKGGMIRWLLSMQNKDLTLFNDVFFNPLHISCLIKIIKTFATTNHIGIFNVGSSGSAMSKAEFLSAIINRLSLDFGEIKVDGIINVPNTLAPRPLNMSMSIDKIERVLNFKVYSMNDLINLISDEYHKTY